MEIVYQEDSYKIMGACIEVYKEMGCGFLEAVYQECLEMEFALQGMSYRPQAQLALSYKGRPLKQVYIPDFVLFDKIVVELKAI
jgi:GxxExxY protein